MNEQFAELLAVLERARTEIRKVIIGQDRAVNAGLMAIMTGQHALIEGLPGIGKTLLVRTFARVLGCDFNRIQFTPDLMPSDITGSYIFNAKDSSFQLAQGPLFTEFLLADEINRAPAKTQSALLQSMQERLVTIDRNTLQLSKHFTVFATQNPIEFEGVYPLPEAQKDRFMLVIDMTFPERDEELNLANRFLGENPPESVVQTGEVASVISRDDLHRLKGVVRTITVKPEIVEYAVEIVRRTRAHNGIRAGAGPRGTQALLLAARALGIINGRDFVVPDDVKECAAPVLAHRLLLRPEYEMEGLNATEVVQSLLTEVPVPK
jgi:MoxR-like ATPase